MHKLKIGLLFVILLIAPFLTDAYAENERVGNVISCHRLTTTLKVYAQPDYASKNIAIAEPGSFIKVLSFTNPFQKNDEWFSWYQIAYDLAGEPGIGYVCSAEYLHNNGFKFDANWFYNYLEDNDVETVVAESDWNLDILTPKQFKALQFVELDDSMLPDSELPGASSADSASFTVKSGYGLTNVKLIIDIMIDPEYCAPDYQYYFAWAGEVMLPLFALLHDTQLDTNVAEGEPYEGDWYDEYAIFPVNGTPYDTIIKILCTAHKFDNEGNPLDMKYATEVYVWNGSQVVPTQQNQTIWNDRPTYGK